MPCVRVVAISSSCGRNIFESGGTLGKLWTNGFLIRRCQDAIELPLDCGCECMEDLLEEMQQCKSVKACIELALTDADGEYEQASAWLACIETIFERFDRVNLMGEQVALEGLDLENELAVVAVCAKGK